MLIRFQAVLALTLSLTVSWSALAATIIGETEPSGNGYTYDNMQPSLAVNYLIATNGSFYTPDTPLDGRVLGEVTMFAGNFAPAGWMRCDGQLMSIAQNPAMFALLGTTYGGDGETTFALPDLRGKTVIGTSNARPLGWRVGQATVELNAMHLPNHTHFAESPFEILPTGNGASFNNMQPSVALNHGIVTRGLWPDYYPDTGEPMISEIRRFAGIYHPGGTVPADGRLLPIADNDALFALNGPTYGGNGETNFAVPNLSDRTPIGTSYTTGINLGNQTGQETTTISLSQMQAHQHYYDDDPINGGDLKPTGISGSSLPLDNMQPSLALHYMIRLNGLFPQFGEPYYPTQSSFIGEIALTSMNFAPRGWAFCEGQILPIAQNQSLYSILGSIYGGDGETNFALPDLRGRTAIHTGQGADLPNYPLGARVGDDRPSLSWANIPHTHNYTPEPGSLILLAAALPLVYCRR